MSFDTWFWEQCSRPGFRHNNPGDEQLAREAYMAGSMSAQPEVDELEKQLVEAKAVKTCEWCTDAEDGEVYETSCGKVWQFIDGGLSENSLKFCPFCGGRVKDVSHFLEVEST
jgi:hypothetical protein